MADETVRQRLEFEASNAIQTLKQVEERAVTVAGKAALLNKNLQDYSRALGQHWKTTLAQMKEQIGKGSDPFTGFTVEDKATGKKADVTSQVLRQTEELARNAQAKNQFATADSNAAKAEMNFDGTVRQTNAAIGEQSKKLQILNAELNKLKSPPQGRDAQGRFTSATPPSFQAQFAAATSYQQQLKLVETTIASLQKKTNLPFKDVGKELGKSFPTLLKDTNLVSVAVDNLAKKNAGLSASFKTQAEMISRVNQELTRLAANGRLNLTGTRQQQVDQLKGVIKEVSKNTGAQYGEVANQLEKMGVKSAQTQAAVRGLNKELTHGVREANVFGHSIDFVRTALGTLTAVGIFTFLSAIQQAFTTAVKAARELEDSLFRLSNVEKILSEGGVETTTEGLRNGINEIKKLFPIFSQEDTTQLVAQIAISTKEFGFQEKQVLDLAKAVAILNIRSTEEETASQTAQKVISAMITDNARGIASLGLSFREVEIQAKAVELGFLRAGESAEKLTVEQKAQVKYAIVLENTGDELQNIGEYMDSNTAKIKANESAWHDLLGTIGQGINNIRPDMTGFYSELQKGFEADKVSGLFSKGIQDLIREAGRGALNWEDVGIQWKLFFRKDLAEDEVERLKEIISRLDPKDIEKVFPNPSAIKNEPLRELIESLIELEDTATGFSGAGSNVVSEMQNITEAVIEAEEKIADIMEDARQKRLDIDEQYRRKIEDANRDHAQKMQDIARDVERKQEDALRNYNQKVEDINRDAAESVAEAQADYREREVEREKEYQRRLAELRERFLMDLEDALRERDARQVLRLIREYNLEKKQLAEKRKNEQKDAERELARKLADIERERVLKLEAARRELAEKQAEIALWAEREREDAAIALQRKLADARRWHQLELQEYQQYLRRKLEELARAIVKEYQLTAAGAQAIYSLLNGYFGASGAVAGLMSGLNASLNNVLSTAGGGGASTGGTAAGGWGSFAGSGMYGTFAEGGTYVATRPTKAVFGEKGPEIATFTPIGRTGQDVNKLFGDIGSGNGGNSIDLRVSLSRDLIAEVVDTTLDTVALHLERLGRER